MTGLFFLLRLDKLNEDAVGGAGMDKADFTRHAVARLFIYKLKALLLHARQIGVNAVGL